MWLLFTLWFFGERLDELVVFVLFELAFKLSCDVH